MKSYVAKLRLHYPLLFILITAFISMQWASAHIHLAEKHDHDGIHYHAAEGHANNLTAHSSTAVDSSHFVDTSNTVDLDNQFNTPSGKNKVPDLAYFSPIFQQHSQVQDNRFKLPFTETLSYNQRYLSVANPRAPPHFS